MTLSCKLRSLVKNEKIGTSTVEQSFAVLATEYT